MPKKKETEIVQDPSPEPVKKLNTGFGIPSFIEGVIGLGIAIFLVLAGTSILILIIPFIIGLILGILAIIFGAISYRGSSRDKYGLIGLACGIITLIITIIWLIFFIIYIITHPVIIFL